MVKGINAADLKKAGVRLPDEAEKEIRRQTLAQERLLVDQLACKVIGVLSDAPNAQVRRKALEKARRMAARR